MSTAKHDYYEVLGVPRSATRGRESSGHFVSWPAGIHPDVNKAADAEDRFKELVAAYEVLCDPQKRQAYDPQFGHNEPRGPFGSGGLGGGRDPFGSGRRARQQRAEAKRERREREERERRSEAARRGWETRRRRERAEREERWERAEQYSKQGLAYAAKGEYDRAIQDYNQALQRDPNYAAAYNNRGIAWAVKGDYDQAIRDYDQAIRLNPGLVATYNNRGIAYKCARRV